MVASYDGRIIAGRFEPCGTLGEGASGTVFIARDTKLGIQVALKVLRSSLRGETRRLEAFKEEAQICARMLSPHIVRVLSFGVDVDDVPYIAYELLPGQTLEQRLVACGSMSLDQTESIVVQVARALARAHSLGVVHRDIKPSNIFLTKDERDWPLAKVLDFGLARFVGRGEAQDIYGTLEYVAPEILLNGTKFDARSDLYALAAVTYQCVTGAPPWEAASLPQLISQLVTAGGGPRSVAPAIGSEGARPLDAWFDTSLSISPDARFRTAREFAESLHGAIKRSKYLDPSLASDTKTLPPPSSSASVGVANQALDEPRRRLPSFTFDPNDPER